MAMPVSVTIEVGAPPDRVFALVSDLPRMGEWSPECIRCEWLDGARGAARGARFKGHNRRGLFRWSTTGEVVACDPGPARRELAFDISFLGMPVARWRYTVEPLADEPTTSRVTEQWEDRRGRVMQVLGTVGTGVRDREAHNRAGMEETLRRLKVAAEGS
jgi:hypothetical protein